MKSRFYLAFILAGIVPVVGLAGFYFYTAINQAQDQSPAASAPAAVAVNPAQQQPEVASIASSLFNAIKNTNAEAANLSAHHTAEDMDTFLHTHTGVSGVAVMDPTGKEIRQTPASPALVDGNYSSTPEYDKIMNKFKESGGKNYEFYTNRLGYPSFVFAVPLPQGFFAEVVLSISQFFRGGTGEYFIVDAGSGNFLYHSDPSKLNTTFNPQHEGWLNAISTDLAAQRSGSTSGPGVGAAYAYLGFGKFGVVHVFPLTVQGAASAKASAKTDLSESVLTPMALGFVIAFALLCIGAAIASRALAAPFRRTVNVILAAAEDQNTLTPDVVKSFGNDEAGHIVQALALFNEKIQERKDAAIRSLNDQLSGLQRQSRQYQSESQEKSQQVTDKLKEIEALKSMAEGLRNQSEQARTEIGKLKGDLSAAQGVQTEFSALQGKYTQLQAQLKVAEAKAVSNPAQASQVRAAAIRTMSDELKNTLGIIKGYVSSVIGAGQGGINEKQQEFLGMVINRSARLEKFINDLVDIFLIEIEQKTAKLDEVNLGQEIETMAFNFQTQTELKNLKFKVEAKPGVPKVPVVKRRLTQLWNVLYLQLIKDAPKGSTIPILVEPVGESVKVIFNDPGLNVTAEGLPKMFDEFYDPKHPSSPQLAGTGLKMALVKTIMSAHGGSAVAEKAEIGTRVILTFSTKANQAVAAAPVASPAAMPAPVKPLGTPAPAAGPKPAVDLNSAFGVGGLKPAAPAAGPSPIAPAATKPPVAPTTSAAAPVAPGPGAVPPKPLGNPLDALLGGKIPSVTAPGIKPPMPAGPTPAPTAPLTGTPPIAPPAGGAIPTAPKPAVPPVAAPAASAAVAPAIKPPVPGAPPAAPAAAVPPVVKPPMPSAPAPVAPPAPAAGAPVAPKAPVPPAPSAAPAAPKPPVPGVPAAPAPPSAAPAAPPVPKAPGVVTGAPIPGMPAAPAGAPAPPIPKAPGIVTGNAIPGMSSTPGAAAPPVPKAPGIVTGNAIPGMPSAPPPGAAPGGPAAPKPAITRSLDDLFKDGSGKPPAKGDLLE